MMTMIKSFSINGIQFDGMMPSRTSFGVADDAFNTFFNETRSNKHILHAVFVDLEPTVIDGSEPAPTTSSFTQSSLSPAKEDIANNFTKEHYTVNKEIVNFCFDHVCKPANNCISLQAFLVFNTGSGTSLNLGPSSLSASPSITVWTAVIEPYNSVLFIHSLFEYIDVAVLFGQCMKPSMIFAGGPLISLSNAIKSNKEKKRSLFVFWEEEKMLN